MRTQSVLLIEDDRWFAEQQVRILTEAGYTVRHVTDGLAGIEAIDTALPDAIVLDVFLPGPNALTLLHEVQSYTDSARIPIILCSSSVGDLPQGHLGAYGVHRMLDKSVMRPADLVAAVRSVLV